ncbi:MAG: hypothetical protein LC797_06220, partial [Chloroflexi bacterium]|nr:hypothetical protein [Chloroflexota bacterium]
MLVPSLAMARPVRGPAWPLGSLFLAGFEASWLRKSDGHQIDMLAATQHDRRGREDYALCRALGIRAVRETARWPLIERAGAYDLGHVGELARLGREAGLAQLWGLMHYGYPEDVDPFSAEFVDRFARYARAVATVLRAESSGALYVAPINEISFHAWAVETGHLAPYAPGRGMDFKRQLVRAALAATNAVWEIDPQARIVSVDPVVRQHAPVDRPDLEPQVATFNHDSVFHGFDLLSGRSEPELGGSRRHLGIIGINYYTDNQWVIAPDGAPQHVLIREDPRYVPLGRLLSEIHGRYGGPLLLAETGAHTDQRAAWI